MFLRKGDLHLFPPEMKLIEKATKQHYRQLNTLSKKSVINNRWDTTKKKKKEWRAYLTKAPKLLFKIWP